jgi:hypothetical protein
MVMAAAVELSIVSKVGGNSMKKVVLIVMLFLAFLAAGSMTSSAKAVCPGGPDPTCGGTTCSFNVYVYTGSRVTVCYAYPWRSIVYSTSGVNNCNTKAGFYGWDAWIYYDVRCTNVSEIRVGNDLLYSLAPSLANYTLGGTNGYYVHFWGYAQG